MPKFVYSAAKGIEQQSGSGFIVQDVPISRSVANDGTAYTNATANGVALTDTEEVILFDLTTSINVTSIANGQTVGEERVIITSNGNGSNRKFDIGAIDLGNPAAGACFLLVWTGSAWARLQ